ncbi:phosphotransferase family protein [Rhodococcus sp. UNC363MFTsu5.1]|uniref:phosphotransferase family protein n=1 Tax=Rhodococcus sp. UNC363MFTsu5.1 TaxID=1449069 RepID=UPI000489779F|nr:phosphotransferase family protein [Rhodococcus sp. UNC363MFTsu5.1]
MSSTPETDFGLREPQVTAWFHAHVPSAHGPLRFDRIPGGRSNLTYAVTDGDGSRWVLRRPPLGMAYSRAHDVLREADVLDRLRDTPVPAPIVVGTCNDESVTGAPFFVMDHIEGHVLRDPESVRATIPVARRPEVTHSLIRALADLHAVDPREVGWDALASRNDYLSRQLRRWSSNWENDRVRTLEDIGRTHDRLVDQIPRQRASGIVHGDFRLDNCLITADGSVRGILDWELTTVGDPLADLGQLLAYWAEPGDEVCALENPPTRVEGFPTRDEIVEAYLAAAQPATVPDIDYYVAFNWWKIACIVEGVYTRTLRGSMGEIDRTAESFGAQAERLATQAWRYAQRL